MYKRTELSWMKHLDFILLDVLSAQLALVISYWIRFGFGEWVYANQDYTELAVLVALFCVLIAVAFNTMHDVLKRRRLVEFRQTMTQCVMVFAVQIVFLFSIKDSEKFSRVVLWSSLIGYVIIASATRALWKHWLLKRYAAEDKHVLFLIADSQTVESVLRQFRSYPLENFSICGIVLVDRDAKGEVIEGVQVVTNLDEAAHYICREWIDEVFISVSDATPRPNELIARCEEMGVTIHLQMLSLGTGKGKQFVEKIASITVMTSSMNIAGPVQLMIKRVIDIFGGLLLSVLALLAIAVFGPAIKRASPGPILYKQERIGQNGRKFRMYKIRSMYLDADARKQELMDQNIISDGMMFKMDFDPRIIGNRVLEDGTRKRGVGDFIRRWSIDEFPQGLNLLKGDMSLVGTRPPTVDEWERYEFHHRARLAMKPGITGMWQVQGRNKITNFEEITRLDTDYIANWDIGLDIRILFKTIVVVLQRKGAM
ncbi:MAG: sugar transferase [Clostridia bacterium]|nr:sugar transferase [Clostridia bacterium]